MQEWRRTFLLGLLPKFPKVPWSTLWGARGHVLRTHLTLRCLNSRRLVPTRHVPAAGSNKIIHSRMKTSTKSSVYFRNSLIWRANWFSHFSSTKQRLDLNSPTMQSLHKRCLYSIYHFSTSFHHLLFYDPGTTPKASYCWCYHQSRRLCCLITSSFFPLQHQKKKKSIEPSHYYKAT